jgi:hypothetical protein
VKRTPLKRRTPIQRRSRVKRFNAERMGKRRMQTFGAQALLCRRLPCCACRRKFWDMTVSTFITCPNTQADDMCHAHHEPPRSCGGKDADTVPLCAAHHHERHSIGVRSFEAKHNINLRQLAAALHEQITRSNSDE